MPEEEKTIQQPNPSEEEVTIALKKGELFQLNLCVVARLSAAQTKFVNAYCPEEQESAESLMNYLTALSEKITKKLREDEGAGA